MGSNLPIVLNERGVVMVSVVPIGACLCPCPRINGGFLKIGVIVCKIAVGLVRNIGDRAVGLQYSIRRWRELWTANCCCTGRRVIVGIRWSVHAVELPKFILARQTKVPITVKDAGGAATAELHGVASHAPYQIVLELPAVLNEPLHLATFE